MAWIRVARSRVWSDVDPEYVAVRVERSRVKGYVIAGGHRIWNNGRTLYRTEAEALAGVRNRLITRQIELLTTVAKPVRM